MGLWISPLYKLWDRRYMCRIPLYWFKPLSFKSRETAWKTWTMLGLTFKVYTECQRTWSRWQISVWIEFLGKIVPSQYFISCNLHTEPLKLCLIIPVKAYKLQVYSTTSTNHSITITLLWLFDSESHYHLTQHIAYPKGRKLSLEFKSCHFINGKFAIFRFRLSFGFLKISP